jgi:hypothetical protein
MSKENKQGGGLDGWLKEQDKLIEEEKRQGNAGIQSRLQKRILHNWHEDFGFAQPEIPTEIREIIKDKFPESAAIVLWMSPSSMMKIEWFDLTKNSVEFFEESNQSKLWEKGQKDSVTEYFKALAEDKLSAKFMLQIPPEIEGVVGDKLNKSVLSSLWILPSPWLWGEDPDDVRDYTLDGRRSPLVMWRDSYKEQVINYMKILTDNLDQLPRK